MNLKEIEYIVKISEEKNLSIAAEKLFITPSALNQQLLNLERSIGTPLFFRSRSGWTPTPAGEIYLASAKEILRLKQITYHQLQDLVEIQKGTLSIGFPPERGSLMFTQVYPQFHKEYPEIVLNVIETSVRSQQQLIKQGTIDIGFMTLHKKQRTDDCYVPICLEELVLAVPSSHPLCNEANSSTTSLYPVLNPFLFKNEPFALMYKESTITDCLDDIFHEYNFIPNVLFQATRACTILEMVEANLCCSIVPSSDSLLPKEHVRFFCLPSHPTWEIVASYRKNSYLSKPAKRFIELATNYWIQSKQH